MGDQRLGACGYSKTMGDLGLTVQPEGPAYVRGGTNVIQVD